MVNNETELKIRDTTIGQFDRGGTVGDLFEKLNHGAEVANNRMATEELPCMEIVSL